MTPGKFTEDQLVEQPAIALLDTLGWTPVNAMHETFGPDGMLGRDNQSEVILARSLRTALVGLNPKLPSEAIAQAVDVLVRDRSAMDHVRANRELYRLVRDGVPVRLRADDGSESPEVVRVIDWACDTDIPPVSETVTLWPWNSVKPLGSTWSWYRSRMSRNG